MPEVLTIRANYSYGFTLGENGWKPGYDLAWQRLDRTVDHDFGIIDITGLVIKLLSNAAIQAAAAPATNAGPTSTHTLATSATTFVMRDTAGAISTSTASFTTSLLPLYTVTTNTTAVTGYIDYRHIQRMTADGSWKYPASGAARIMNDSEQLVLDVDDSATTDDIRLRVWDVTAAAIKRVSRGITDSGGAGFRLLRVPN